MTNSLMERLPLTALLILNGIMLGFGGYLILHDDMTVGGFMAFFYIVYERWSGGLQFIVPDPEPH